MSFILDALRKSEHERQKSTVPGVAAEGQAPAEQRVPVWALATIGLLTIALLAIAVGWWWSGRAESSVEDTQTVTIERPSPEIRSLAQEARRGRPPRGPAQQTTQTSQPANATSNNPASNPKPTPAEPVTPPVELPPTLSAVVAGGMNLPHLNLDIHVYAPEKSDRFVFVNARKYREGDTLREGPEIVEITDTGVLLAYQGEQFLLPRD